MRRLGCPILFGGGSSRSTTREGLAPRRRAIVRDLSPYSSQQRRWRGGAAFWACSRASTTALQPPPPRRGACARKSPNQAAELPLPLGAAALALGGASPQRLLRGDGGDAVGEAAQNRTRRFGAKRVCPESAALGFPPPAGVAPLSIERDNTAHDQPRARRVLRLARPSPPASAILAPTATQRGRCEDASRRARESFPAKGDKFRTRPRTTTGRGAARRFVERGRNGTGRIGRQFRNNVPFF